MKLLLLSIALFPTFALSQNIGSIEGDLYFVTQAGEIRQGAANTVYLIPKSAQLISSFDELCSKQEERSRESLAQQKSTEQELERLAITAGPRQSEHMANYSAFLQKSLNTLQSEISRDYDEKKQLFTSLSANQVATGMQAHYRFETEAGSYWIYAMMKVGAAETLWLVSADIEANAKKNIDLDNNNALPQGALSCSSNFFSNLEN